MKRNGKQANDDVCHCQVGDVHVGDCPHPLEDDDVYHQAVSRHCYKGGRHIQKDEEYFQDAWESI